MSSTMWPAQRQCSRLRVDEATVPRLPHTNVDAICRALVTHGVCIVEGAYPTREIEQLKFRATRLCARALRLARTLPWRWREYITSFSETMRHRKRCVDLPDGTQLIELAQGRYDVSYKMTTPPFLDVLYAENGILREVARRMLIEDYKPYVGALPSGGHASAGHWHRDTYPLFGNDRIDILLPPFYYTAIVPLASIGPENGATEFYVGSHRQTYGMLRAANPALTPVVPSAVEPGSLILFDGRVFHRGGTNETDDERSVLYVTLTKKWYDDY